jgi:hypothetical protein
MPLTVFINQINSFFEDLIQALPNHARTAEANAFILDSEANAFILDSEAMPESFTLFDTYVPPAKGDRQSTEVEISNLLYLLREAALNRPNAYIQHPHTIADLIAYFHRVLGERFESKLNNVKGLDYTLSSREQNAPWNALAKNLGLLLKNAHTSHCIDEAFYNAHTRRFQYRIDTGEMVWMINHHAFLMPLLKQDIDPISLQPLTAFDLSEFVYSETLTMKKGRQVIEGNVMLLNNCLDSYNAGFGFLNVDTVPQQLITVDQLQQIIAKYPDDKQPDWINFIATPERNEPSISIDTLLMLHQELCILESTNQYSVARLDDITECLLKLMDWSAWPGSATAEDPLQNEKHKFLNQIIYVPSKIVAGKFVPTTVQALFNLLEGSSEKTERQEGDRKGEKEYPGCSAGTILNLRRLFLDYGMKAAGPKFPAVKKSYRPALVRSKTPGESLSFASPPIMVAKDTSSTAAYDRVGFYNTGYKTPPPLDEDGLTSKESSPDNSPNRSPGILYSGSPPKFDAWLMLPPASGHSSYSIFAQNLPGQKTPKRAKPRGKSLGELPDDVAEKMSDIVKSSMV